MEKDIKIWLLEKWHAWEVQSREKRSEAQFDDQTILSEGAVNYLRNYPNIYTLQEMLGYTTLDMVKRYLAISQNDLDDAHRHASPVEKWGL
ncbi:MAG: hypothetical protein WBL58_04575 [Peptococcia bacterium]|jgi:hypothetical protein